jgi:large subunit ribosomal protein L15e
MGMYKYIREAFEKEYSERSPEFRARLTKWRKEPTVLRVERPTNLSRARSVGYKAKKEIIVTRVRVGRGMRKRRHPWGGRKPAKNVSYLSPGKSLQHQAEEKAATRFRNFEVLNSYWAGQDGTYKYFEVVMHLRVPGMASGRTFRGLTSAAKKHRQKKLHGPNIRYHGEKQ